MLKFVLKISFWAIRHPLWMMLLLLATSGLSAYYAATHLKVDTDTNKMLDLDLPFMQQRARIEKLFPQDKDVIVLMIESEVPEISEVAAKRLTSLLATRPDAIHSVYLPTIDPFFDRQGLLYQELDQLERLANDLARAQPFIGRLYHDFSLGNFLSLLTQALEHQNDMPVDIDPVLARITDVTEALLDDHPTLLSWRDLFFEPRSKVGHTLQFAVVAPVLDYTRMPAAELPIQVIHDAIDHVRNIDGVPITVRITGEPVLEYDELISIEKGTEYAGIVSLILICSALLIGFRSWKLTIATLITLTLGLAYSLGFASVAVPALNVISISFAVLYIGMGVDYATHLALRYREFLLEDHTPNDALRHSLRSVSPALILCALTTSLAMFSFIPTAYRGISELGIIAGGSMFIVVAVTMAAVPALLRLMPLLPARQWRRKTTRFFLPDSIACLPYRHSQGVRQFTLLLALAGLGGLCGVYFDFNPINLRDPHSESVQTFKKLLGTKETSPMYLTALADGESEVHLLEHRFESLETVSAAVSIFDFVPPEQEEKLQIIDEMALLLGPQLDQPLRLQPGTTRLQEVQQFHEAIGKHRGTDPEIRGRLMNTLDRFIHRCRQLPPSQCQDQIDHLQFSVLATFPMTMEKLRLGLEATPFGLQDLPPNLRQRWVTPSGIYRIDLFPELDLNVLDHMIEFVEEVRQVYPEIAGLPVSYIESMRVIVGAFQQAFATAIVVISLLLLFILKSARDTLLVLLPLVLGAILPGAVSAWADLPFNYANIIALPLLFGLGVDSGIHMVHRIHELPPDRSVLTTSTARGIFFSALTTLCSFVSLAFISHVGIASLGRLLAIGLSVTLICTFFILPAFAVKQSNQQPK